MSISKKLTEIQNAINAPKSQYNKFGNFYYRNVEDIQSAVKPLLIARECSVTVTDELTMIGERYYIKATATISDGENSISTTAYARESESKKGMDDSMCTGTASSYARKYALGGLLLLDDQKDADGLEKGEEKAQTKAQDNEPTDWYNTFDKDKAALEKRVEDGEAPEMILKACREKFKVSKETANKILALGK